MSASSYRSVARWLVDALEPVRRKIARYSLKDTLKFIELISERHAEYLTMASLDVTSLFTTVPLLKTINYLCDLIVENEFNIGIPVINLKELLSR